MTIFPYNESFSEFTAQLEFETEGRWLRPTLWARYPRPQFEQLMLDRVLMQCVSADANDDGQLQPCGLLAAMDFNPRAQTCQMDIAFRPGTAKSLIHEDWWSFHARLLSLWPLQSVFASMVGDVAALVVCRGFSEGGEGGSSAFDLGDDLVDGLGPHEGLWVVVPV